MSELMATEVYNAAVRGDLALFDNQNQEQWLKKTCQKNNIIHIAAQHKQFDFVKRALTCFPSPSTCESLICDKNWQGNTPLHIAAEVGDEGVIDQLYQFFTIKCGSDRVFPWRVKNKDGNTPAHVALLCSNVSVAIYLVEKDDYVAGVTNHSKETLLHLAIQYHVFENYESQIPGTEAPSSSKKVYQPPEDLWPIVELLLKINSLVTCWADAGGSTPLHRAASLESAYCSQVVKAMLDSCPEAAEVHDERSGNSILHLLANRQVASYEQGLELLDIPHVYSLINSKNHQRDTPLHLAARNRDTTMVQVLLKSSPQLGIKNTSGVSAGYLVQQLEIRITETPVEHKRILTKQEREAAEKGDFKFLKETIDSLGMSFLNSETPMGGNILHILLQCYFNSNLTNEVEEFIVQAIQKLPTLISQQDCNGDAPVHFIANKSRRSSELLNMICDCHFNKVGPWRLKNGKGNTPLHLAVRSHNYDSAMKLLELDGEVAGYVNNRKQTPLHLLSLYDGNVITFQK